MDSTRDDEVEPESSMEVSSILNPPLKHNVSFSFNFDMETLDDDAYTDSDAELQIDVSEVDDYQPPSHCKRKRELDNDISVLNEMEEEIERQLDAKAAKTNLTATNVKNILKHVITNEHVMAMVKRRLHNTDEDVIFEPKLTRAKAKELAMSQPNIPWPITPVKKTKASEVQVLIEEELPEDSSDEEYDPDEDQLSDDERETENSSYSDMESQPSTPATPGDSSVAIEEPMQTTPDVRYDSEGIFKIPVPMSGIPHVPTEEESIGQRTRSKLCLSETPLEQIEQAFVPPDITTDMYDWGCDLDEDWNNFLKEFTQPLAQELIGEDDPEADPEYNILEDEESDLLDKEELRMDKAVKVTRKELNNLVAELFEFTDMFSKQEQETPRKKKCPDTNNSSIENTSINGSVVELLPVLAEPELPKLVNSEQRVQLDYQLRQHVQLMIQHFSMSYMHPKLHSQATTCKNNLNSLKYLSNGPNSAFNVANLPDALKLVADLETKFVNPKLRENYINLVEEDIAVGKISCERGTKYIPRFLPEMQKLMVSSKALMYPQLLPEIPFRCELTRNIRSQYLNSEEHLIALGLEQFMPFVLTKPTKFKSKKAQLADAAQLIVKYLLPCREPLALFIYIKKCRNKEKPNPIKHWYNTGMAPLTIRCTIPYSDTHLKAPKDQPISILPKKWHDYLNGVTVETDVRCKQMFKIYNMAKLSKLDSSNSSEVQSVSIDRTLLNPVVNMLPTMSSISSITSSRVDNAVTTRTDTMSVSPNEKEDAIIQHDTVEDPITSIKLSSVEECKLRTTNTNDSLAAESEDRTGDGVTADVVSTGTSEKSDDGMKNSTKLPELRKTTPRLAKIRSAQNMKLMARVLGSKGSSPNSIGMKSRGKNGSQKNLDEPSTSAKVDNEDEIAELMLASTTIKKDTANRKKAKQAREAESVKRLLDADNELSQEERATKFAVSYLQKLHTTLESASPETFKTVIKLFLDYSDRVDAINQIENEESPNDSKYSEVNSITKPVFLKLVEEGTGKSQSSMESKRTREENRIAKDSLTIDLYRDVCERLKDYPEMRTDFLLFLKPHQAAMIGKSVEHTMLQRMNEFVDVAQIYFAKQPSRLSKVMQAVTQLASDHQVTLERANAVMGPLLKGHSLVMDAFLQVLPNGKPPESLFAPHMFENLTCPPGPHDKNKVYAEDAPELYENIEMPVSAPQEDPYGGDNCKCDCHNMDDPNLKTRSEHCVSCGTRFLNGRIYLQTSEGLRPAKITFPGDDQEKQENIARVSLKITERFVPVPPTRRRRKSSKNVSDQGESNEKPLLKSSPTKDSEDSDRSPPKSRRSAKSPPKPRDRKKSLKSSEIEIGLSKCDLSDKKCPTSPVKTKREERAEKREAKDLAKLEQEKLDTKNDASFNKSWDSDGSGVSTQLTDEKDNSGGTIVAESYDIGDTRLEYNSKSDVTDSEAYETAMDQDDGETNISLEKMDVSSDSGGETTNEVGNTVDVRPWTRQEDMIILQNVKKEYSENTFLNISETLGDRTVQQVKDRFQILLSLLEKMA